MLRKLSACLAIGASCALISSLPLQAKSQTQQFVQIPCSSLRGSGSFSDPVVIGLITRPTLVVGCPRLTSGSPFSSRRFSFTLVAPASANSYAGAGVNIAPGEISAVHPSIVSGAVRVREDFRDGFWIGNPNQFGNVWRLVSLSGLSWGNYLLRVDKVDSPLRSQRTPNFNLLITP